MGIFSRFKNKNPGDQSSAQHGATTAAAQAATPLTGLETECAILMPVLSAMIGDGEVNDAEFAQLANICALAPALQGLAPEALKTLAKQHLDAVAAKGHEAVVKEAAAKLSPALRETAFCFVMRMVVADGVVNENEVAAVNAIGTWLGLSKEQADPIIAVVGMMQRPKTA